MIFADESGFSLIPTLRRTWAPRGRTPLLRHRFSWPKLSAISGVTLEGRLFFGLHRGTIRSQQVVAFLRALLRQVRGRIIVVWDNIGIHKSRLVKDWLATHRRLTVEPLPPYAPELNADEGVWQYIKHELLPNFCPRDVEELEDRLRRSVRTIRPRPELVRSFFHRTGLSR